MFDGRYELTELDHSANWRGRDGRTMSDCAHEWKEEYYGYHCSKCDLFYPFGLAPWEYFDEPENDSDVPTYNDLRYEI
jgi:hypothetical protein